MQGLASLLTMKTYLLRDLAVTSFVAITQATPEYLAAFFYLLLEIVLMGTK